MQHPEHICRFNDEPQSCECYDKGHEAGQRNILTQLLKDMEGRDRLSSAEVGEAVKGMLRELEATN